MVRQCSWAGLQLPDQVVACEPSPLGLAAATRLAHPRLRWNLGRPPRLVPPPRRLIVRQIRGRNWQLSYARCARIWRTSKHRVPGVLPPRRGAPARSQRAASPRNGGEAPALPPARSPGVPVRGSAAESPRRLIPYPSTLRHRRATSGHPQPPLRPVRESTRARRQGSAWRVAAERRATRYERG